MFFALNMLVFLYLSSAFFAQPSVAVENPEQQNYLQQAQQAYGALRFDDCRILLDRALRNPDNSRESLVKIYRLRGLVEAAMGQPIAAKRAFANMIVLDPKASLKDDYAPKIMRTYEAARASLPGEKGLQLSRLGDEQILMGQDAQIAIRVDDTLAMVEQLVVRFRVDKGAFQQRILTRADHGLLRISAERLPLREQAYQLEVEAKAQNAYGATLAVLRPVLHIKVVSEIAEDVLPLYRQWWLWASLSAGIGVMATAGIVTALMLTPQDTRPRDVQVVLQ